MQGYYDPIEADSHRYDDVDPGVYEFAICYECIWQSVRKWATNSNPSKRKKIQYMEDGRVCVDMTIECLSDLNL